MNYDDTKGFMHAETRTDIQHPTIHQYFFEMTAEEQAEQERIKLREMSVFEPIEPTRAREITARYLNKNSATDEQLDYMAELIAASITRQTEMLAWKHENLLVDEFNSPRLYDGNSDTAFINPTDRYCRHWPILAGIGKLADKPKFSNQHTKQKKNKADYKAKFYKNTAKQSKPSPMLMSLIGKTK